MPLDPKSFIPGRTSFSMEGYPSMAGSGDIIVDDPVLPSQYRLGARTDSEVCGEKALMLAVLEDALQCFQGRMPSDGQTHSFRKAMELRKDAAAWLFEDELLWPFSYLNICDALEIDATALRRRLCDGKVVRKRHRIHGAGRRHRVKLKPRGPGPGRPRSKYFTLGRGN